jgi:hypothetical protein
LKTFYFSQDRKGNTISCRAGKHQEKQGKSIFLLTLGPAVGDTSGEAARGFGGGDKSAGAALPNQLLAYSTTQTLNNSMSGSKKVIAVLGVGPGIGRAVAVR